jgi:hypothetical protein
MESPYSIIVLEEVCYTSFLRTFFFKRGVFTRPPSSISSKQGQLGDETRGLWERFLANSIRNNRLDGSDTASANWQLGLFYHQLAEV